MLLELLPPLAGLADRSADCSRLLTAFCSLAAAACSPRDLITACLEVLSNLVEASRCASSYASSLPMCDNLNRHPKPPRAQQALAQHTGAAVLLPDCLCSLGPDGLQFACNLLLMLPEQVAKLSRRKAANAAECCLAAAALAEVCACCVFVLGGRCAGPCRIVSPCPRGQGGVVGDARVLRRKSNTLRAGWCLTCMTGVAPAGAWAGAGWVVAQSTWPGRSTGSSTRQCRRVVSCCCCNAATAGHLPCSQLAGIRRVC